MKKKAAIFKGIAAIMALLLFITSAGTTLMFHYDAMINQVLGTSSSKVIEVDDAEDIDTDYYTSKYGTDYTDAQAALELELDVAAEMVEQMEEGAVLLKNENSALPLSEDSRITIFGNASVNSNSATFSTGASSNWSGGTSVSVSNRIPTATFTSALQTAFGTDNVNTALVDNVYSSMSQTTATEVVEADISSVTAYENTWSSDYNDAAIVMFNRVGSEGSDVAMYAEDGTHMLALLKEESDLMEYLQEQKEAGVFDKIIVIINTEYLMELDWLYEYDVDAAVLCGNVGSVGFTGLANILIGDANPSGHLTDTYAANSLSAPATTYAADNTYEFGNVDEINAYCIDGGEYVDYYIIYAEGIYVGYKYYETRYEDSVMGTGNADSTVGSSTSSAWNYNDEVVYTFGYGLSYTTFEQELLSVSYDADSDTYQVEVKVTNTGEVAGKDVVEVYAQTPYGDYEKENNLEKASVMIVGFDKTDELEPGESQTLTVEVMRYMLASYDSNGAEGYILSSGTYYLAIGDDAHDALNNILNAKGYSVDDGMDYNGNADKTYSWTQDELDTETYRYSIYEEDVEVTNQFDYADLNYYGIDFTYLSRSDWEGTFPETAVIVNATEELMDDLDGYWYETPEDAPDVSDFTQGEDNGISFIDMLYVDYDDEEAWDEFLDQLTVEEMASLINDTNGTSGIDSINLPAQSRINDNMSAGTLIATGESTLTWPSACVTARTWNTDRYTSRGTFMSLECAFCGITENWYGGGNIHRTPFGGRANQYYSEDGNFSYIVGKYEAAAMQANGTIVCMKHLVLNDQETHRESVATFANEQSIREEYLRAFEGSLADGNAAAVMTSFNRIGAKYAGNNYELITNVLRGEWGFIGRVTPDGYSSNVFKTHYLETLAAGVDYNCLDPSYTAAAVIEAIENGDGYILQELRRSAKNNIYAAVHSTLANGLSTNSVVVSVVPWWKLVMLSALFIFGAGFVGFSVLSVVYTYRKKKS